MRRRSFALLAVLATATIFAHAQTITFTALDYPGATVTNPNAVNRSGVVVGDYFDSDSGPHGFAHYQGQFVAINVPNATFTSATGINNDGTVSGFFRDQT